MIVVGFDPGSTLTGFAIIKKEKGNLKVIDFGCINTEKITKIEKKIEKIYKETKKIIFKNKPNIVSVETLFFFKNLKTVIPVSQTKGVILLAAEQYKIPILEFTPLQVKLALCGYGKASKRQLKEMVKKTVSLQNFDLNQKYRKKDDAFDALGIALCAFIKNNKFDLCKNPS